MYVGRFGDRSTESDSEVDGRGGGGASHGTAAELEQAQGGIERSRFSPGRIAEFKQLASDPRVYEKVKQNRMEWGGMGCNGAGCRQKLIDKIHTEWYRSKSVQQ